MEKTATAVKDAVVVEQAYDLEGQGWLVVAIHGDAYQAFKKLPDALMYDGQIYGKSAFDSDRMRAYFRTGVRRILQQRRQGGQVMAPYPYPYRVGEQVKIHDGSVSYMGTVTAVRPVVRGKSVSQEATVTYFANGAMKSFVLTPGSPPEKVP